MYVYICQNLSKICWPPCITLYALFAWFLWRDVRRHVKALHQARRLENSAQRKMTSLLWRHTIIALACSLQELEVTFDLTCFTCWQQQRFVLFIKITMYINFGLKSLPDSYWILRLFKYANLFSLTRSTSFGSLWPHDMTGAWWSIDVSVAL